MNAGPNVYVLFRIVHKYRIEKITKMLLYIKFKFTYLLKSKFKGRLQ